MPLWLRDNTWIVATGWGIARWDGGKYDVYRYPRGERRADQDPPAIAAFAVLDDEGKVALVQREGEELGCWRAGVAGSEVEPLCGGPIRTALGLAGGRLLLVAVETTDRARAVLRQGRVEDGALVAGERIALPAAKKVPVRAVLFAADTVLFPEDRGNAAFEPETLDLCAKPNAWAGTVRLSESPYGIAVTSSYSGLVAVLDPATLAPRFALRFPAMDPPYQIFALPVPQGVLVTMCVGGKQSGYVLVDERGEILGSCGKLGNEPAMVAETEGVLCGETVEIASNDRLWTLALPTLRPRKHPGGADAYPIAHAVGADGSRLVAYTAHNHEKPQNWRLVHTPGGTGRRRGREVQMPDFRPPPEPASPAEPPRVVGPATLGLVAEKVPWQVAVGEEAVLQLELANRGGPVKGVYIELSGDALAQKSIVALDVTVGDQTAPFTGDAPRAEVTELAIDPGYVEPTGKRPRQAPPLPPPPSVSLTVRVRGAKAGNGLLMIRVGALSGGASAMQGRGIVVS